MMAGTVMDGGIEAEFHQVWKAMTKLEKRVAELERRLGPDESERPFMPETLAYASEIAEAKKRAVGVSRGDEKPAP